MTFVDDNWRACHSERSEESPVFWNVLNEKARETHVRGDIACRAGSTGRHEDRRAGGLALCRKTTHSVIYGEDDVPLLIAHEDRSEGGVSHIHVGFLSMTGFANP